MSNKTITFSIAAYNIEKTISKCLNTILDTGLLDEIEILVVNDGSSDNTSDIARRYEKKYPGVVRLINKENGGHGSTINMGITEAKGRYFKAVDGDDWVNTEDTYRYISRLKNETADIVLCDHETHFDDRVCTKDYPKLDDKKEYSFKDIVKNEYWMSYHSVSYKTELLKNHNTG